MKTDRETKLRMCRCAGRPCDGGKWKSAYRSDGDCAGRGQSVSEKYLASAYVHNGFGKTCGLVQVQELGTLETPIALTNTLNVGKVADA